MGYVDFLFGCFNMAGKWKFCKSLFESKADASSFSYTHTFGYNDSLKLTRSSNTDTTQNTEISKLSGML